MHCSSQIKQQSILSQNEIIAPSPKKLRKYKLPYLNFSLKKFQQSTPGKMRYKGDKVAVQRLFSFVQSI